LALSAVYAFYVVNGKSRRSRLPFPFALQGTPISIFVQNIQNKQLTA
jgi:hypothetical protein